MSETSYYLTLGELTQSVRLSTETVIPIVECGIVDECVVHTYLPRYHRISSATKSPIASMTVCFMP